MTPPRRRKLIEVALPLEAINTQAAREKSIRHGHPSTLHLWWARRPLAACRAVLFAQLVDDPDSDPQFADDPELAGAKRAELFNLIEELVKWENSNNTSVINHARAEIARCVASRKIEIGELKKEDTIADGATAYDLVLRRAKPEVVNHFLATHAPPVLDPFAGGGSIPLEAQRLGLRAHASDLNPVSVLINKALIEIPPKFAGMPPVNTGSDAQDKLTSATYCGAQGLAEDVRHYGQWMRDEAEKRIGHLYPKVKITPQMAQDRPDLKKYLGQELTVIAWLWARTVPSSNPAFADVPVPLVASYWLSKKKGKEAWIKPSVDHKNLTYRFDVQIGKPTGEYKQLVENGTKLGRGCKFRCIMSDSPIPEHHVKTTGMEGRMGDRLLAVVCEGNSGRIYLSPTPEIESAARVEKPEVDEINAPIADDKRALWCLLYGLTSFDRLFTPRQLTALTTFSDLVMEARQRASADAQNAQTAGLMGPDFSPQQYADAIATYLAFGISKIADRGSTISGWDNGYTKIRNAFGRQALPMTWDFAECNVFSASTGNWMANIDWIWKVIEQLPAEGATNELESATERVQQLNAAGAQLYALNPIISCDPPYYDNIGYADLSDFFYVWLRRTLRDVYLELLSTALTPKSEEMIASPYRHGGNKAEAAEFFEEGLTTAISQWRQHGCPDYPTTIFYAFKQAETDSRGTASTGWETFLSGVIEKGFTITGTWPIRTELSNRMVGTGTNALASSIVLVCVPREPDAPMATRREFMAALKNELPDALHKLQSGNIAPVDLAQAAIGPGMAVFSRYQKVIESDGSALPVRDALMLINQVLDEVLAEQEGEFDNDTRWAIAWFEQNGMEEGLYGNAETLSKAKVTSVQGMVQANIVAAQGGKVRLLRRNELPAAWRPADNERLTCWEATQHLIRRLEEGGETAAAALLAQLGPGYSQRARDLAYRLYSICERKKWADEALAYNSLVTSWSEISKLSASDDFKKQVQLTFV